jgi:hydroxymethylglutaryl-CoA reductase
MNRIAEVLKVLVEIADKAESVARYRALVSEAAARGDLDLMADSIDATAAKIAAYISEGDPDA